MKHKFVAPVYAIIVACVAAGVIFHFYPETNPFAGFEKHLDKDAIEQRAVALAAHQGIDPASCRITTTLHSDPPLLARSQKEAGASQAARMSRGGLPAYYWIVKFTRDEPASTMIQMGQNRRDILMGSGFMSFSFDMFGHLLALEMTVPDSTRAPSLSLDAAYELAVAFLLQNGPSSGVVRDTILRERPAADSSARHFEDQVELLRFRDENIEKLPSSVAYSFTWSTKSTTLPDSVDVRIKVNGDRIQSYSFKYRVTEAETGITESGPMDILSLLANLLLGVFLVVMGIRKIRAYEIGWKKALFFGIVAGVLFGVNFVLLIPEAHQWEFILAFASVIVVIGGAMMLVWAVSEATGREVWVDKFFSLDLLTHGHFLHSTIGRAVIIGPAAGIALSAIASLLVVGVQSFTPVLQAPDQQAVRIFAGDFNPLLVLFTYIVPGRMFIATAVLCFASAVLARRLRSSLITSIIVGFLYASVAKSGLHPVWIGLVIDTVVGFGLAMILRRTDLVTTFLALVFLAFASFVPTLFTAGDPAFLLSGWIFVVLVAGLFGLGFAALATGDRVTDPAAIAPSFAQHITERLRLQRELEVAREVQMSFLPKREPRVQGLDIASCCVPALEVGGDYFDFIELGPHHLAVAIGDVSGKGTQAAFYMTLAKGFLRALARDLASPAEVLSDMNALFYENVERGHFITMMYAIFDTERRSMTVARAGHNPLLHRASGNAIRAVQAPGIAMGLERGDAFSSIIRDVVIPYASGDIFVFYTDGFSEAMTKQRNEFGEDGVIATVERASAFSAREITDTLVRETLAFAGNAAQHDDMTAVVVKIA